MALNKLQHQYTDPLKVSSLNVDENLNIGGTESTGSIIINGTSFSPINYAPIISPNIKTPTITNTLLINTNATSYIKQSTTDIPTADMFQITNSGFPNVTAGVSALQINYFGGAAAVESSAVRIDLTPGTTSGGTWNGLRVFPTTVATTGVTYNALKFDNVSTGAGTDNVIFIGTGYDNIISYNGTQVINGLGQINLAQVTGTLAVANGGTGGTTVNASALNSQAAAYYADHIIPYTKTGALTVSTGTIRYRLPWAATIISTTAAVGTAPTGASLILDVLKNGTTIYSTTGNRPTIAATTNATTTSPTPNTTALAAGDYLTVNVAQIGSTVAGSDLSVFIEIQRA
jgi:hypothetical protein